MIEGSRKSEIADAVPDETSTGWVSGAERTFGIETALEIAQWDQAIKVLYISPYLIVGKAERDRDGLIYRLKLRAPASSKGQLACQA